MFAKQALKIEVLAVTDPASREDDIKRFMLAIDLPRGSLRADAFTRTDAVNQIPATLLFRDGRLVDRRLGAQSADQLSLWVAARPSRRRP